MPTLKKVQCVECSTIFEITLKRYNESLKNNWKFYCSSKCLSTNRSTGEYRKCTNNTCTNKVYILASERDKMKYCSSSCAAIINNSKRKGIRYATPAQRIIRLSGNKKSSIKDISILLSCGNKKCKSVVLSGRKYCSSKCHAAVRQLPSDIRRKQVITKITEFYSNHQRIPYKKELKALNRNARTAFGTWNKAIKAAGYSPNPVKFAHHHIAKDGHKVDSMAEKNN